MTLENVRLEDGNLCTDRSHQYVASFDTTEQSVVEVDKTAGTIQKSWPADAIFTEVYSVEFDGFYWWTLEQQTGGFVVRKWRKRDNVFAQLVDTFSYSGVGLVSTAMAVEYYSTTLSSQASSGSSSFSVSDASNLRVGDTCVVGPSTVVGYVGDYDEFTITGVTGSTISVDSSFGSFQQAGSSVYATRAFWIFVDGVGGVGQLIKYSALLGNFLLSDSSILYNSVSAAVFFFGKNSF